jgi:hypothetical protein
LYIPVSSFAPKIHAPYTLKLILLCTRALLSVFICYFYVPFVCNYCLYYVVTAIACVLLLDHIVPNYVDVKLVSTSLSKVLHGVGLHQFSLRNLHKLQRLVMI